MQRNKIKRIKLKEKKACRGHEVMSLRLKLTLSHVLIAVLPMLLIGAMLYSISKKSILEEVEKANMVAASQVATIAELRAESIASNARVLMSNKELITTVSKNIDHYKNGYYMQVDREEKVYSLMQTIQMSEKFIKSIAFINKKEIIDPMGRPYYAEETQLDAFFESQEYEAILQSGNEPVWYYGLFGTTDIFFTRQLRNIYKADEVTVLVIAIDPFYLESLFENEEFGEEVVMSLMDVDGRTIVSSGEKNVIGQRSAFAQELDQHILKQREETPEQKNYSGAFIIKEDTDEESVVIYETTQIGWTYITEIPTKTIFMGVNKLRKVVLIFLGIIIFLAIFTGVILAFNIVKPMVYIRDRMKAIERGNLYVRCDMEGKYELGQLAKGFNSMAENMAVLIREMKGISTTVESESESLKYIANQSVTTSQEISQAVEGLSKGATEQVHEAERTAMVVSTLVDQINKTEETFNQVAIVTSRTKRASVKAVTTIEELNRITQKTVQLSASIKDDMDELSNQLSDILGIIDIMNSISGQTNLLALNATIEAARAGEAGKGFAIVAEEVRKLANQSEEAAQNIGIIVNKVYQSTKKTGARVEEGSVIYSQQEGAVENTVETFQMIEKDMGSLMNEVDNIYILLSALDDAQLAAKSSISNIVGVAQESASSIEEVLAAGEEQEATAHQLHKMANDLTEIIVDMNQFSEQFKLVEDK